MGKIKTLQTCYNKIFFKNKPLLIFSVVFPVLFYIFFTLVFTNYDDVKKIPIGLIDQDQTSLSELMVDRLRDHDSISVRSQSMSEAHGLMERNKIEAIFVLKPGFEDRIKSSDFENSIQLIYLDKSNIGPALGDIIAGTIISDLAIYKAANTSLLYEKKYDLDQMFTKTETLAYHLYDTNTFEMDVISQVTQPRLKNTEEISIQNVLKSHTTFGFSLVIFSFVFLFANSHLIDAKTLGVDKRLVTLGYKGHHLFLGQWSSLFTTGLVMAILQILFIVTTFKVGHLHQVLVIFLTYLMHYVFLINLTMVMTRCIDRKNRYQSFLAPLIFLLGLVGGAFWSIELLSDSFIWVSNLSPFYWSLKLLDGMMLSKTQPQVATWLLGYLTFNGLLTLVNYMYFQYYYTFKLKA